MEDIIKKRKSRTPKINSNDTRFNFRINKDVLEAFKYYAKKNQKSASKMILNYINLCVNQ